MPTQRPGIRKKAELLFSPFVSGAREPLGFGFAAFFSLCGRVCAQLTGRQLFREEVDLFKIKGKLKFFLEDETFYVSRS